MMSIFHAMRLELTIDAARRFSLRHRSLGVPLLAPLLHLLLQLVVRVVDLVHHLVDCLSLSIPLCRGNTLPNLPHKLHNSKQLIRQPSHNRTPTRRGGMTATANDVLTGKKPMPPAEAADVLEQTQVEDFGLQVFAAIVFDPDVFSALTNVGEEVAMWFWTVVAEVFEDFGEWISRHWDLEEVVEKWDDAVIGAGLAAEVEGLVVVDALVDYAVGKHGLVGDAKDEGAIADVVLRSGVRPHILHGLLDDVHGVEQELERVGDGGRACVGSDSIKHLDCALDEAACVSHHVDMSENEASLGRVWIKTTLETTDEAEVVVLLEADVGIREAVVEQAVCGGVRHEWWDVEPGDIVSIGNMR